MSKRCSDSRWKTTCATRSSGRSSCSITKHGWIYTAAIQRHGGLALIESAATAFAAGMPDAAARATVNATVLKLEEIGPHLIELGLK